MEEIKIDVQPFVGAVDVRNTHLLASQILENKDKKIVLSIGDEGFNIVANGLEKTVKEICDYNQIPYVNITFSSGDILENSQWFAHNYIGYNGDAVRYTIPQDQAYTHPVLFRHGIFYARPDNCRLYSFYKHLTFSSSQAGLASMHFDPSEHASKDTLTQIANFVIEHPEKWNFIKDKLPYSDFGFKLSYPIVDHQAHAMFWQETYQKMSLEIVAETVTDDGSFFITEKTFRPILYNRLFTVIGSPGFEQRLKGLGFDIFDDVIDKLYDNKTTFSRIDHIYGSLETLFCVHDLSIMNKLKPRLEKNSRLMKEFLSDEKEKYKQLSK